MQNAPFKLQVIIPAGGVGTRMGLNHPKQLLTLAGRTILERTVALFEGRADGITVAVPQAHYAGMAQLLGDRVHVVIGGETRYRSVRNAIDACGPLAEDDLVLIHDAARPFWDPASLPNALALADRTGAVIYACKATDTIKQVDADGVITATLDRDTIFRAQTPQIFRIGLLKRAYFRYESHGGPAPTDEASLLEAAGIPVTVFPDSASNVKITHREDLAMLQAPPIRIGHGYDVHAFDAARPLYLGGILVPDAPGLAGHSDADVCIHALIDALLGAAGKGDIGCWFPDSDRQFKNIRSTKLLDEVVSCLHKEGYALINADVTIIAQTPKLAAHLPNMVEQLAGHLQVEADRLNIKATTTEGLGFVGRKEGIAAHAVALLTIGEKRQP